MGVALKVATIMLIGIAVCINSQGEYQVALQIIINIMIIVSSYLIITSMFHFSR